MTTRATNVSAESDSSTVSSNEAPLTSAAGAVTARYPWQTRKSNDLVLADTARPNNSSHWNATTARLSNDTPLITS